MGRPGGRLHIDIQEAFAADTDIDSERFQRAGGKIDKYRVFMPAIKLPPAFRSRFVWPLALFCFISHRIHATVTTAIPNMALFARHCSCTKSKCRLFAACKGYAANQTRRSHRDRGVKFIGTRFQIPARNRIFMASFWLLHNN